MSFQRVRSRTYLASVFIYSSMIIKILTAPFLAYFLTLLSVAIMGRDLATDVFGNNVLELWLAWIQIITVFWILKYFKNRLTI